MEILEGGVRFPVDPLLLNTFRYYRLCPDQLPPNFYQVVSYVSRLNEIFDLQLDHHDINHMYSLCGNKRTNYYIKVRDVGTTNFMPTRLQWNSTEEFVRVQGNWFAGEILCPFSRREVGSCRSLICFSIYDCFDNLNAKLLYFCCRQWSIYPGFECSTCEGPELCAQVRDICSYRQTAFENRSAKRFHLTARYCLTLTSDTQIFSHPH